MAKLTTLEHLKNTTEKVKQYIREISEIDGAGFHNSIYRDKFLGTSVTDEQWTQISSGKFKDLYIGDYWTINRVNWRIAAFDYYYQTGDTPCTTHHVVIVPDMPLYNAQYHVTDTGEDISAESTTEGGYVGSDLYTGKSSSGYDTINHKGLYDEEKGALGIINKAFGAEHILQHRQCLINAVTDGRPSAAAWYDSKVELMTEQNVYGCKMYSPASTGALIAHNKTNDLSQYPLFALSHKKITDCRQSYWLRDVVNTKSFACINVTISTYATATAQRGVRPAFSIIS